MSQHDFWNIMVPNGIFPEVQQTYGYGCSEKTTYDRQGEKVKSRRFTRSHCSMQGSDSVIVAVAWGCTMYWYLIWLFAVILIKLNKIWIGGQYNCQQ